MTNEPDKDFEQGEPVDELSRLLQSSPHPRPRATLTGAIREQCVGSLEPTRSLGWWPRIGASFGLCTMVVLLFVCARGLPSHGLTEAAAYGLVAWSLVQLGMLGMGLGRVKPVTLASRATVALLVPGALFGSLALMGHQIPWSQFFISQGWWTGVLHCGLFSMAAGAATALSVMWLWRRSDPFHPSFSGSVAGLVGGLSGAMAAGAVCQDQVTWHLWLGHGLSVVVLIALGHFVGRRWLAP